MLTTTSTMNTRRAMCAAAPGNDTPPPHPHIDITLDLHGARQMECRPRHDLGRDAIGLSVTRADGNQTMLVMDTRTACSLYAELRRFLGEYGGPGPKLP